MKRIKIVFELIFIFILPIVLLACCFNIKKEYDENGNEVNKSLEFNNIFEFSNERKEYQQIQYKNLILENVENDNGYTNLNLDINLSYKYHLDYFNENYYFNGIHIIFSTENETYNYFISFVNLFIDWDFAVNNNTNVEYEFIYYDLILDDEIFDQFVYQDYLNNDKQYLYYSIDTLMEALDVYVQDYLNETIQYIYLIEGNFVTTNETIIISDNAISKVINSLYNSLGIQDNYILQIIVIYTLLWLIMWFIWHLIYLPLDFLSQILIRRVDYAKD